jgi:zinc D-Ala-D-Ala dipeptidase
VLRRGAALTLFLASLVAAPAPAAAAEAPAAPGRAAFVDLATADPTILHDIRYATAHNFVGRAIRGYQEPRCLLSRRAATALTKVQSAVRAHGFSLKVYDCYRPRRAVSDFADWAGDRADTRMKREFYPRVGKATLFDDGYLAHRSGHSRGSTVDLTLVRLPAAPARPYVRGESLVPCYAPYSRRFPDNSLDMGTGYDCFDTLATTLDPRVTGKPRANRLLLRAVMTRGGFTNYSHEWWHYTLNDEPYPSTYFDFPVA